MTYYLPFHSFIQYLFVSHLFTYLFTVIVCKCMLLCKLSSPARWVLPTGVGGSSEDRLTRWQTPLSMGLLCQLSQATFIESLHFYRRCRSKRREINSLAGCDGACNASTWQEGEEFVVTLRDTVGGVWRQPEPKGKRGPQPLPHFILVHPMSSVALHTFLLGNQINKWFKNEMCF